MSPANTSITDPMETDPAFDRKDWRELIAWIALVATAMAIGSLATIDGVTHWYPEINKPFFNPPNWIFGPVWTVLYLMMALAAWRVARVRRFVENPSDVGAFVSAFVVQLVLNSAWSVIFFGFRSPFWALVEIVVLWLFVLLTVLLAFRHVSLAGWLLVPYLAWVTFAAVLNFAIVLLN